MNYFERLEEYKKYVEEAEEAVRLKRYQSFYLTVYKKDGFKDLDFDRVKQDFMTLSRTEFSLKYKAEEELRLSESLTDLNWDIVMYSFMESMMSVNEDLFTMSTKTPLRFEKNIVCNNLLDAVLKERRLTVYSTSGIYLVERITDLYPMSEEDKRDLLQYSIRHEDGVNHCHELSYRYSSILGVSAATGYVAGGLEGQKFYHSWLEDGDYCLDVETNMVLKKDQFYQLLGIELIETLTPEEIQEKARFEEEVYRPFVLLKSAIYKENSMDYQEKEHIRFS